MIRERTMHETCDGQLFADEDKAREHVANACREIIDARLASLQAEGKLTANDRFKIVMAIIPNSTAALELCEALHKWTEF